MQNFISFLEGITTFISPCLLPMLPIYISYFSGGSKEHSVKKTFINSIGFVVGFSTLFILMGALAGTLGGFLNQYQVLLNVITGLIVIFFGLHFLGIFRLNIFKGFTKKDNTELGFFSALLFGVIFSIGWTPCVGVFLGSALMLASQQGSVLQGILMLLCYSLGLGIPFVASAILIDRLKDAFNWIKSHYALINKISGSFLVVVGILMMTGLLGRIIMQLG